MKTLIMILTLALFSVNGYSQKTDAKKLLENKETRSAIFNEIANNHELLSGFLEVAKGSEHASMMMGTNNQMIGEKGAMVMTPEQLETEHNHQMMGHDNMMGMMKENPEMMQNMGQMMDICENGTHSEMCSQMAEMMAAHPNMMKMCMQMMNEKTKTNKSSSDTDKANGSTGMTNNTNRPRYKHK